MGWLGLDDTDTLTDGCTTYTLHCLLNALPDGVTASNPSLVRLWPFAEQRTRGNAAVAVELLTEDEPRLVEFLDAYWNEHLAPLCGLVSQSDHQRPQAPTDPGMVWFSEQPSSSEYYSRAVQSRVSIDEGPLPTRQWGGRGCIGAIAAVVWHKQMTTWEAIAWRKEERWKGVERNVCNLAIKRVSQLDRTFMTRDPTSQRSLISPRGTCPVLFGVRGTTQKAAVDAAELLLEANATEPVIGMRVFQTNQASDDHLHTILSSTVKSIDILRRGTTKIETDAGEWLAFAESGDVKLMAQSLQPGDRIDVYGLESTSGVVHIEKMRITYATPLKVRPVCTACNRTMKAMGTNQGVRCPECKAKQSNSWCEIERKVTLNSWVQPPIDARRHLARPLEWDGHHSS